MGKAFVCLLGVLSLIGCAKPRPVGQTAASASLSRSVSKEQANASPAVSEPLSDAELKELVLAANDMAIKGGPLPDKIMRRLKPVKVYGDRANLVIALHRDAHEEGGYYVVPLISSFRPGGAEGEWTWKQVKVEGLEAMFSDSVYEYFRKR
jgi:hypothetical protein